MGLKAMSGPAVSRAPVPREPDWSQPRWFAPNLVVALAPVYTSGTSLLANPCSQLPWICRASQLLSCLSTAPWKNSQPPGPTEPTCSLCVSSPWPRGGFNASEMAGQVKEESSKPPACARELTAWVPSTKQCC